MIKWKSKDFSNNHLLLKLIDNASEIVYFSLKGKNINYEKQVL